MSEIPMDRILIKDLRVRCILGVDEIERREKQEIIISIELHADLSRACSTDALDDTIDYRALSERVARETEHADYCLLEALAAHIAKICLENQKVKEVRVSVEKSGREWPGSAAVEIRRSSPA